MRLVYFSSVSENTHRFVQKLGVDADRVPVGPGGPALKASEPYLLLTPTYGGGHPVPGKGGGYVPKQVIRFLNDPENRALLRGVIAAGNTNFGAEYGYAGNVVSNKCQVPFLYRFELMGTDEDVHAVRQICAAEFAIPV
ncbi:NrdI protein [Segniliparus rotundus DSM 44985]|uniref:Protein NrdI n=2 Tax=Segniliparus rotundus TaxID=286802 RepID=D6ZFN0_SEGRD|nr:NrdI protein [Segniliparus rotundus DSM 44985]